MKALLNGTLRTVPGVPVTTGLEEILKIKAEKEETSIGFDYYATLIELNGNLEIVRIHQDYDVAQ